MVRSKCEVRHSARERRRVLVARLAASDGGVDAAGRRIAERILSLLPAGATDAASTSPPTGARPLRIAAYESLPSEPPTGPLIAALLASGHEVIVPITLADFSLEWTYAAAGSVGDVGTVTRQAPAPGTALLGVDALAHCDLIVTPGLSVDRNGVRLGQGGGCYDRALAHRDPSTLTLTLLHEDLGEGQHGGEASEEPLPCDEHDRPVDGYVTTSGRLVLVSSRGPG